MEKYNIGEVWWIHFPYSDKDQIKRRPAIVIDDDTIAILAMYVTTKNKKDNPYSIFLDDWREAGLPKESWTRIDRIVKVNEWTMDCKIGELSQHDFIKVTQLVKEILTNKLHEFSLIAVRNSEGKYLQKYDDRWKSWLFPYVGTTENNKENVDDFVSQLLGKEVETNYIATAKHCKYSVSDCVYKIFNHKLYGLSLEVVSPNMEEGIFVLNGNRYKWMSIEEMENDDRILDVNEDIVAFIKSKCE